MRVTKSSKKKASPKPKRVTRKATPKAAPKRTTTKKVRKVGSGRTKGSYSFINVKLVDLNKNLPEGSVIMISRKWAEGLAALGITLTGAPIKATTNAHNSMKKPVDISIENVSEESAQVALKTDF